MKLFVFFLLFFQSIIINAKEESACFEFPLKAVKEFHGQVSGSFDSLWLENRKNPKECSKFIEDAMKTGAPERGEFEQVRVRLDAVYESSDLDKKHMLFRAFPDIYYLRLKNKQQISEELKALYGYSGYILGDVHVENFGIIKINEKDKTKYKLLVNDFDESGVGPYYSDVLRLISSAKLAEKNLEPRVLSYNLNCLMKAYKAGVSGGGDTCNQVVPTARVEKRILKAQEDYLATYQSTDLSEMSSPCVDSEGEKRIFSKMIPYEYYEKSKEHKQRCKKSGGSGLLRSVQYIETEKAGRKTRYKTMETKTISQKSAIFQFDPDSNKNHSKVIQANLDLYGLNETIHINGSGDKYISREKDGGNKSYRPYKVGKEDKISRTEQMLMDQFFTLGKMHKKSFDLNTEEEKRSYIKDIEEIKPDHWDLSSKKIVEEFELIFDACSPKK